MEGIFVTWAPYSRRSVALAAEFGFPLYLIHYLFFKRPLLAPIKYVMQGIKTWIILIRRNPDIIFVTTPPIFAALAVFFYTKIFRKKYVIDSHSGSFYSRRWKWSVGLHNLLSKHAVTTIVTNRELASIISSNSVDTTILEDKIPDIKVEIDKYPVVNKSIAVINTFSEDEPVSQIIDVAKKLPEFTFYVTGDTNLANQRILQKKSKNVKITGFLKEGEYISLIYNSNITLVLSTWEYTLLSGIYESIALEKVIVTSKTNTIMNYFNKGCVYVSNDTEDIVRGIKEAFCRTIELRKQIKQLKEELRRDWLNKFDGLKDKLK